MPKPSLKVVSGELVSGPATVPVRAPLPKTARISTLSDLKRDAVRVYRAGRQGRIPSDEVSRWMFSVGKVGDIIEKADIEPRLEALEKRLLQLTETLERRR